MTNAAGTGDLDDLEAILSAPPPALGEPLRQKTTVKADGQSSSLPAQQGSSAAAGQDASATSRARSSAVTVPPLALTDAHREGRRISPKHEVRCSITRAVVSPRSSDVAAALQYRSSPSALAEKGSAKGSTAARQESSSSQPVEQSAPSFADTVSSFRGKGTAGSERITGWLPIHRKAGAASSSGQGGAQPSVPGSANQTISLPVLGAYEKMTVAASLVGAVAGGAAAGPLGVSMGEHPAWSLLYNYPVHRLSDLYVCSVSLAQRWQLSMRAHGTGIDRCLWLCRRQEWSAFGGSRGWHLW